MLPEHRGLSRASKASGDDGLPVTWNPRGALVQLCDDLLVYLGTLECPFLVIWADRMQRVRRLAVGCGFVEAVGYFVAVVGPLGVGERGLGEFDLLQRWFGRAAGAVLGAGGRRAAWRQAAGALAQLGQRRVGVVGRGQAVLELLALLLVGWILVIPSE